MAPAAAPIPGAGPADARHAAGRPPAVEVSELSLGDDEFASNFGSCPSQFADGIDAPRDPWTSRRRLD